MRRAPTLFLKISIFIIGTPVVLLCIFAVPSMARFVAEFDPYGSFLQYVVYMGLYATAAAFFTALYQAFMLLRYIDQGIAFSERSVTALKKIKICAIIISLLYLAGMPLIYVIAEADDAPGLLVLGLVIMFASTVIAVFAAVLQKLLQEAVAIKSEHDLTV